MPSIGITYCTSLVSRDPLQTKLSSMGIPYLEFYKLVNLQYLKETLYGTNLVRPHASDWSAVLSRPRIQGSGYWIFANIAHPSNL
jgi:hypothetical protein